MHETFNGNIDKVARNIHNLAPRRSLNVPDETIVKPTLAQEPVANTDEVANGAPQKTPEDATKEAFFAEKPTSQT